jgi:XTP/dITP diphosphohydrolase
MTTLIFATQNEHKSREVEQLLGGTYHIQSLATFNLTEELPETGHTLEANAEEKALYVFNKLHKPCFAEDTGLEVEALKGEPGVYTARYAGPQRDNRANMQKVLQQLQGNPNRKARFRTVLAYIPENGATRLFEGIVEGHIAEEITGAGGFGYDPIFIPEGYTQTFAELGDAVKNQISHRARAVEAFRQWLHLQ